MTEETPQARADRLADQRRETANRATEIKTILDRKAAEARAQKVIDRINNRDKR